MFVFMIGLHLLGCQSYVHVKMAAVRTADGSVEVTLCNLEADTILLLPKGGSTTYTRVQKNSTGDTATVFLGERGLTDTRVKSKYNFIEVQDVAPRECYASIRISGDSGRLRAIYLPVFVDNRAMYVVVGSERTIAIEIDPNEITGGFGPTKDPPEKQR